MVIGGASVWSELREPTRPRNSLVTDMMMSLRALVEKGADADVLREMIGFAAPSA